MAAHFAFFLAAFLCGSSEPPATTSVVEAVTITTEQRFDALAQQFAAIRESLAVANGHVGEHEPQWLRLSFRAPMTQLADEGSARALAWLVAHFSVEPGREASAPAIELELCDRLLPQYAGENWLGDRELDVLATFEADAAVLGPDRAAGFAHSIYATTGSAELRERALLTETRVVAPPNCTDRDRRGRAVAMLRSELTNHPSGHTAQRLADAIWRYENLAPGSPAPEFAALDVDGNELRLSDWRGKVVLLDVWSFASHDSAAHLTARQSLFDRRAGKSFAVVGVNVDREELPFRRAWEEHELRFPCAFEHGAHGRVQTAWHLDGKPTSYLIDRSGHIRAIGLDGAALEAAITELMDEPVPTESALERPSQRR
jgi:peroxiredoxin